MFFLYSHFGSVPPDKSHSSQVNVLNQCEYRKRELGRTADGKGEEEVAVWEVEVWV